MAMTVMAETIIPANTYHPYNVLNQWGSKLINQSQDIMDSVTIKNTKKMAESLKFFFEIGVIFSSVIRNGVFGKVSV